MARFHGTKINPDRFDKSQLKFYLVLIPMAILWDCQSLYYIPCI